jgi:sensor c-di-GMP phosphodiesterase-like protein
MYIPDSGIAAKALAGLDQPRRDFANHFADRISLLPVESLHDDKRIRTELLLELQSRFTPEEAARISYTSSDILVSIALSIVRDRHESVEKAKRLSLIINVVIGLLVSVAIIAIYMFFSQEAPKPLRAEAKAETRVAPATK